MKPYFQDNAVTIYHGDCREILPQLPKVDLVLTDPPYESQHQEYGSSDISFLNSLSCQQLIFWSARDKFPLDYTALHIWDKRIGTATQYEMIYERNGGTSYNLYSAYRMNNALSASWVGDEFLGHPSQKPIRLLVHLISEFTCKGTLILDPFMGSGTTLRAAKNLGRKAIGIEIEEKYCEIAAKRMAQTVMELNV
jgi:site-specific DNA-methyltransferase (adenine-specific)